MLSYKAGYVDRELPVRSSFAIPIIKNQLDDDIANNKPLYILSAIDYPGYGEPYKHHIYGALEDGRKCLIILKEIDFYFDVLLNNPTYDINIAEDYTKLRSLLTMHKYPISNIEVIYRKPFRGFNKEALAWARISINDHKKRKEAIKLLRALKFRTATDEDKPNDYGTMLAREYDFSLSNYNIIKDYKVSINYNVDEVIVFECNIQNIYYAPQCPDRGVYLDGLGDNWKRRIPDEIAGCRPIDLKSIDRKRLMTLQFDIETISKRKNVEGKRLGDLPRPYFEEDYIIMLCGTCRWTDENDAFYRFALVAPACNSYSQAHVIVCRDENDILDTFAEVLHNMRPDIISGFNIADYDMDFIVNRLKIRNKLGKWFSKVSCSINHWRIPKDDAIMKWNYPEINIKIDAENNMTGHYFQCPGVLMVDTMAIFRKIYIKESAEVGAKSLKFFLQLTNVGHKVDMPIHIMNKIHERVEAKSQGRSVEEWALKSIVNSGTNTEEQYESFINPDNKGVITPLLPEDDYVDVVHYCVEDSFACDKLWIKRNIIIAMRAIADLAWVSLSNAFLRAGGIKVRTMLMANGRNAGLVFSVQDEVEKLPAGLKYPGAYVVDPLVHGIYTDRPVEELDVESLYPSIMIALNLSPEKIVKSAAEANQLMALGYTLRPMEVQIENGPLYTGWSVFHNNDYNKMGLNGLILEYLKRRRRVMKKELEEYEGKIKVIDKLKNKPESERTTEDLILINQEAEYVYQCAVIDATQLALKIQMNTFYGESGNQLSPFYEILIAGGVTTTGVKLIQAAQKLAVDNERWHLLYGDSVTGDTPILLKDDNNQIFIKTIEEISEWTHSGNNDKEFSNQWNKYKVWSKIGWTNINRSIRHKTNKKIYRIVTHTGLVDVTEDHSLLNIQGEEIKPVDCNIGTELYHSYPINTINTSNTTECHEIKCGDDEPTTLEECKAFIYGYFFGDSSCGKYSWALNNQDMNVINKLLKYLDIVYPNEKFKTLKSSIVPNNGCIDEYRDQFYDNDSLHANYHNNKKVPTSILNNNINIQKYFMQGYYCADDSKRKNTTLSNKGNAGLYYLLKNLGYNVCFNRSTDKPNIFKMTCSFNRYCKNPNAIKYINIIKSDQEEIYVYDLTTDSHTFQAGIGNVIVHNTDSLYAAGPDHAFTELDNEYTTGAIDKDTYWKEMVITSMKEGDKLEKRINDLFYEVTGTKFVNIKHDSTGMPSIWTCKKKYAYLKQSYIPAKGIMPSFRPTEVNDKVYKIKGIELIKRGRTEVLQDLGKTILYKALHIDNDKELCDIVEEQIKLICTTEWDHSKFIKTAAYRPNKDNKSVKRFVARMAAAGVELPENGQRFKYVVVTPKDRINIKGNLIYYSVGDLMEYPWRAINQKMIINLPKYLSGELTGMLARFTSYMNYTTNASTTVPTNASTTVPTNASTTNGSTVLSDASTTNATTTVLTDDEAFRLSKKWIKDKIAKYGTNKEEANLKQKEQRKWYKDMLTIIKTLLDRELPGATEAIPYLDEYGKKYNISLIHEPRDGCAVPVNEFEEDEQEQFAEDDNIDDDDNGGLIRPPFGEVTKVTSHDNAEAILSKLRIVKKTIVEEMPLYKENLPSLTAACLKTIETYTKMPMNEQLEIRNKYITDNIMDSLYMKELKILYDSLEQTVGRLSKLYIPSMEEVMIEVKDGFDEETIIGMCSDYAEFANVQKDIISIRQKISDLKGICRYFMGSKFDPI